VVKGDENTEKEGEKNTQKTNKPTEEANVTNQWERCSSEIHETHYDKFLHFFLTPKNPSYHPKIIKSSSL
jgi:hypothetical protein